MTSPLPVREAPAIMEYDVSDVKKAKPIYGYYRLKNGWITVNVTSPAEELAYFKEGVMRLDRYPTFDFASNWSADNPFETLFMFGGAKEMPVEQVLQCGFHIRKPQVPRCRVPINQHHKTHNAGCWPTVDVVFPQLDGTEKAYPCNEPSCTRSLPGEELPTQEAYDRHTKVMHSKESGERRNSELLGTSLADALAKALSTRPPVVVSKGINFTPNQLKVLAEQGIIIQKETEDES